MTVSIANLRSSWTNVSVTYTGWGLNVNVTAYEANSKVIKVSTFTDNIANVNVVFSVDSFGNLFANGNVNVSSITAKSMNVTTLNVTTISANSISGNAANSLAIAMSQVVFDTVGSFTYTPPSNLISAMVRVTGAGGGGGGADGGDIAQASGGGGGGAGGTAQKLYTLTELGTSCNIVIGEGGNGGSGTNGTTGSNGAASTFTPNGTITSVLTGGAGEAGRGGGVDLTESAIIAGGFGGSASNGDINMTGNPGMFGIGIDEADAAGGGSGGASYYGGAGRGNTVPQGVNTSRAGGPGLSYGAGGGGAACLDSTTGSDGGKGANGAVVIIEYKRQG